MKAYRFYCMSRPSHVDAVNVIDCQHDSDARTRADELLLQHGNDAVEMWDKGRLVARLERVSP